MVGFYTFILAFYCLEAEVPDNICYLCNAPIRELCVQFQILNDHDCDFWLKDEPIKGTSFAYDMRILRKRWHEMKWVPLVHDLDRFPDADHLFTLLSFNREHHDYLKPYLWYLTDNDPRKSIINMQLEDNEIIGHIYDNLFTAKRHLTRDRPDYYRARVLMMETIDIMGMAYYEGKLPPPVPVWRFIEIK